MTQTVEDLPSKSKAPSLNLRTGKLDHHQQNPMHSTTQDLFVGLLCKASKCIFLFLSHQKLSLSIRLPGVLFF
jgi:hypothetical protein